MVKLVSDPHNNVRLLSHDAWAYWFFQDLEIAERKISLWDHARTAVSMPIVAFRLLSVPASCSCSSIRCLILIPTSIFWSLAERRRVGDREDHWKILWILLLNMGVKWSKETHHHYHCRVSNSDCTFDRVNQEIACRDCEGCDNDRDLYGYVNLYGRLWMWRNDHAWCCGYGYDWHVLQLKHSLQLRSSSCWQVSVEAWQNIIALTNCTVVWMLWLWWWLYLQRRHNRRLALIIILWWYDWYRILALWVSPPVLVYRFRFRLLVSLAAEAINFYKNHAVWGADRR